MFSSKFRKVPAIVYLLIVLVLTIAPAALGRPYWRLYLVIATQPWITLLDFFIPSRHPINNSEIAGLTMIAVSALLNAAIIYWFSGLLFKGAGRRRAAR